MQKDEWINGEMGTLLSIFNLKNHHFSSKPFRYSSSCLLCFLPSILNYKKAKMKGKRQKEINTFVRQIWHQACREKRR